MLKSTIRQKVTKMVFAVALLALLIGAPATPDAHADGVCSASSTVCGG